MANWTLPQAHFTVCLRETKDMVFLLLLPRLVVSVIENGSDSAKSNVLRLVRGYAVGSELLTGLRFALERATHYAKRMSVLRIVIHCLLGAGAIM